MTNLIQLFFRFRLDFFKDNTTEDVALFVVSFHRHFVRVPAFLGNLEDRPGAANRQARVVFLAHYYTVAYLKGFIQSVHSCLPLLFFLKSVPGGPDASLQKLQLTARQVLGGRSRLAEYAAQSGVCDHKSFLEVGME